MTQQKLFYQKIICLVVIALLLVPIYILGRPAQWSSDKEVATGGKLSALRAKAGLSETNLGKIDPTGSAMKLATFGMRGVAISILWHRSQEYEKRADWDNVVVTGRQITTLEPHFITIWDFVGWQLAYNASAMFDDYRERYRWVINGFEFIQEGTTYNKNSAKLYVRTGWTISQKVGIADEKKQYRRLFREDEDLARRQSEREINVSYRDNWLLGYAFYKKAEELFEFYKTGIGNETRLLFYGRAPLNRIRFAEWMSIDGCGVTKDNTPLFDVDNCERAWKLAEDDWKIYSNKEVETTIPDREVEGKFRRTSLDAAKEARKQIEDFENQLKSFLPEGVTAETIIWDRWNNVLDDRQRASLYERVLEPADEKNYNLGEGDYPVRVVHDYLTGKYGEQPEWDNWQEKLYNLRMSFIDEQFRELAQRPSLLIESEDEKNYSAAFENLNEWQGRAISNLKLKPDVLAQAARPEKGGEAMDIVAEINQLESKASFSKMFREIMGADYHEAEVSFEQTPEAREARRHRQAVRDKFYKAEFEESNKEFLACFDSWIALLDRPEYDYLNYLPQMQSELMDELEKYVIVLEQLETVFPKEFSFQRVIRRDPTPAFRLRQSAKALDFARNELAAGKYREARDDANLLTLAWESFNLDNKIFELGPIPETIDGYFDSLKLWVQAWEASPQSELELAKQTEVFNNYPGKNFLEFMIQKRDDAFLEIESLEIERMNNADPARTLEILEKEVALWADVVERAPILKYDATSELTGRIHNTIQEYRLELQKQNKTEPEDFPLKSFPAPSGV